jgi:adenylyltransferase/sulfurtransferase
MPLAPLVDPVPTLPEAEQSRTLRHAALAGFGELGQRRLAAAHIAVIGAGGLGSPVILALAAAGVGRLTIIDDDVVDLSNLQRQVLHGRGDVGAPKTDSAVRRVAELSATRVDAVPTRLTSDNASDLLRGAHLVVDGSDSFVTREAVAAATEELRMPLVWGAIQGTAAQVTVFWSHPPAGRTPVVLDDLYPRGSAHDAPSCAEVGVLGPLCMQVGGALAVEAVKLVAGVGEPLLGRVLLLDGWAGGTREIPLAPARARGREDVPAPPVADAAVAEVTVAEVRRTLEGGVRLLDVREPWETARGVIPGSLLRPLAEVLADPGSVGGPVLVVCQVGGRARRAASALRAAGVEASVLSGGYDAWRRAADGAPA